MKILFVCAMKKEAIDITEALNLKKIEENKYRKDNMSMLITNIGKQRTAIALTRYLENEKNETPDMIINVGYAGSTDLKIGQWVTVQKSYNYEWDIPGEERFFMPEVRK